MATVTFDISKYDPSSMGQEDLMSSIKNLQAIYAAGLFTSYPLRSGNTTISATITLTTAELAKLQTLINNSISQAQANLSTGNF